MLTRMINEIVFGFIADDAIKPMVEKISDVIDPWYSYNYQFIVYLP